jgi:ABC-type Fe3+ transport system permease subunit
MKQFIAKLISTLALTLIPATAIVHAQASKADVCQGIGVISGTANCDDGSSVSNVITSAIGVLAWIVGIVSVVVIIIAGLTLTTSSGDSGAIAKARNTILYAAIGLFLAISAGAIVSYVVGRATDTTNTSTGGPTGGAKPGTSGTPGGSGGSAIQ